jgi:molybdopterin-binding protein
MKRSVRNALKGKAAKTAAGAVNGEGLIKLPGGTKMTSIISKESAQGSVLRRSRMPSP